MGYGHLGISSAVSGKGSFLCWQLAGALAEARTGLPVGIAAGFGGWSNNSVIDGSNAVYEESLIFPGLAVAWRPGFAGLASLSLGAAIPIHKYNAFGAVESRSNALDLGLLAGFSPGGSSLQAGFAYHNVLRPEVRFPDGRGVYKIGEWASISLAWVPPGRWARLHWEWHLPDVRREKLLLHFQEVEVNAWELEWRPRPMVGLKFERTRSGGQSSWGLILRPEQAPLKALYLEVNAGHDRFRPSAPAWLFGKAPDEGRGASIGLSLGAGM
jgi:hypothetical protein